VQEFRGEGVGHNKLSATEIYLSVKIAVLKETIIS